MRFAICLNHKGMTWHTWGYRCHNTTSQSCFKLRFLRGHLRCSEPATIMIITMASKLAVFRIYSYVSGVINLVHKRYFKLPSKVDSLSNTKLFALGQIRHSLDCNKLNKLKGIVNVFLTKGAVSRGRNLHL